MENKEQKPTNKEKRTLITVGVLAASALIMDVLICLVTYYAAMGQFNKSLEEIEENSYVVKEETKTIYNNLKDYLKDNTTLVLPDNNPGKIISFSFDSGVLNIAAEDNDKTLFYNITTTYTSIEDTLNSFKDQKPQVDAYTIAVSGEKNDDTKFNPEKFVQKQKYIGHASYIDGLDTRYVSFIGQYDERNISVCFHEEYREDGLYNVKKVNVNSHPLLYDFLYYALY